MRMKMIDDDGDDDDGMMIMMMRIDDDGYDLSLIHISEPTRPP